MNTPRDTFWETMVDAATPNAAEMATAERDLRDLGPVPALSPREVEALVLAATRPAPLPRSRRRLLASAAAALLVIASLGWVGFELVWPEGNRPLQTLDYSEAILVATAPGYDEDRRLTALGVIDNHCGEAFPALRRLCAPDVDPALGDLAQQLRDHLVRVLIHGSDAPPRADGPWPPAAQAMALDDSLPIADRMQALTLLAHHCLQGMRAFRIAAFTSLERSQRREVWRQRLLRDLRE